MCKVLFVGLFAVCLVASSRSVYSADEYCISVCLNAGKQYEKIVRLEKGHYEFSLHHCQIRASEIRLEAELACSDAIQEKSVDSAPSVRFEVANDGEIWSLLLTNTADHGAIWIRARLAKNHDRH